MTLAADRPPTHRPHPLTRAELARRAGRSRAAITLALQGSLAAACLDGGRVDALHPVLLAFARRHWGIGPAELTQGVAAEHPHELAGARRAPAREHSSAMRATPHVVPRAERVEPLQLRPEPDIESLLHLTVFQITERYGSTQACADYVALRKQIATVARLELANREKEKHLIPRDFVAHHVFGAIDRTFRLLLRDMPNTLAPRSRALVLSGEPNEAHVRLIQGQVGDHLTRLKYEVVRALRELHEPQEAAHDDK